MRVHWDLYEIEHVETDFIYIQRLIYSHNRHDERANKELERWRERRNWKEGDLILKVGGCYKLIGAESAKKLPIGPPRIKEDDKYMIKGVLALAATKVAVELDNKRTRRKIRNRTLWAYEQALDLHRMNASDMIDAIEREEVWIIHIIEQGASSIGVTVADYRAEFDELLRGVCAGHRYERFGYINHFDDLEDDDNALAVTGPEEIGEG